MVGATVGERLAIVETDLFGLKCDVKEIKADVKTLLRSDAMLSLLRWVVPVVALVMSVFALVAR